MKQAVLGATGNIGGLLVEELLHRGIEVTSLSRFVPSAANRQASVRYLSVDAASATDDGLLSATKDIGVLYVTLAIPYSTSSWQHDWPRVMRQVLRAATANGFKIVFLDNTYMYGLVHGPMTEETPFKPSSQKGSVRAEIATMLMRAMESGEVRATIGRSADFYGPKTRISNRFFEGTATDSIANWFGTVTALRTFNYTIDNARALAILGNDDRADQAVWHLPAAPATSGSDFIALATKILGKDLRTVCIPGDDMAARDVFTAEQPEVAEMLYQYDNDYVFDSSRFQHVFGMKPTPYAVGFRQVYDSLG